MFYRENGQFKSTYASDQQMLPILQDRIFMAAVVLFAFLVVPFIVIPFKVRSGGRSASLRHEAGQ